MILRTAPRALLRCPRSTTAIKSGRLAVRSVASLAEAKRAWNGKLVLSEEVEHALQSGSPIIALESAIITHGMPYPTNLTTAQSLELIFRESGITPATIALINGRVHIGLNESQLTELADPQNHKSSVKVSRRDLAPALAMGYNGGTTVAGTMVIANSVGIKMFVTGGIGGVHRGAESSMDVSADLVELGRTPMAVLCAGAKSILDIPRTLEVLETEGVCVATYGPKPDFPAFYTPSSGVKSPWSVPDATMAARLIHTGLTLPQPLATLLAVPIPEQYTAAGNEVQAAVEQAVRESVEQGIDKRGKEVTPWLLKRVGELSGGKALELNIELIKNNARVGVQVARELAKLEKEDRYSTSQDALNTAYYHGTATSSGPQRTTAQSAQSPSPIIPSSTSFSSDTAAMPPPDVLVFGSAAIDLTSTPSVPLIPRTTTPGSIFVSPGGVARNIAEAAQKSLLGGSVKLVAAIGSSPSGDMPDALGSLLSLEMQSSGLRTDGLIDVTGGTTAGCTLALDEGGDLVNGVADMGIVEHLTPDKVSEAIRGDRPKMVVFDCNLQPETISAIITTATSLNIPTFCDPTSTPKLPRLLPALRPPSSLTDPRPLTHISPNLLELDLLHSLVSDSPFPHIEALSWEYINSLNLLADFRARLEAFTKPAELQWLKSEGVITQAIALLPFISSLWIKAGPRGVVHVHIDSSPPSPPTPTPGSDSHGLKLDSTQDAYLSSTRTLRHPLSAPHTGQLVITHYPALPIRQGEIVSTTGAGDTLVGGLVAGLVGGHAREETWVYEVLEGVGRTMRSRRAVG